MTRSLLMVVGAGTRQTLASYLSMHTVPETTASSGHLWSGLAPCAATAPAVSASHADAMIPRRATVLIPVPPFRPMAHPFTRELDAGCSARCPGCHRGEAAEETVLLAVRTSREVD